MSKASTFVSAGCGRLLRATLACLLTVFLLNQTAAAALPVPNPLDKFPSGSSLQVHMNDGQLLRGKLVSHSGLTFQFVQAGSSEPMTIATSEVALVEPVREQHHGLTVLKGVLVGGFFALAGVALACM